MDDATPRRGRTARARAEDARTMDARGGALGRAGALVDNAWTTTRRSLPVVNPHDGSVVGAIARGSVADVDDAVQSARKGFATWSTRNGRERAKTLRAVADGLRRRRETLARLETTDCGKPLDESAWDVDDAIGCFEYYADRCERVFGERAYAEEVVELPDEDFAGRVRREPLGVIGLITPWNYPLLMATWKVAPALASGCAVVLKPSEEASLTCQVLGDVCVEAGLPPGALCVVTGRGDEAGAALCAHRGVDKISFTGSFRTGQTIMRACAQDVKPVSLELGGKSALVIFDDCDLEKAVEWAMFGCFWTNGQICSATSRVLVHENIRETFLARLKEASEAIPVGDPLAEGCRLGPLASAAQYKKVTSMVNRIKRTKIHLLTGGNRPRARGCEKGFYIEPTVFVDPPLDSEAWREEIFGPVMCVRSFRTEEEVIAITNDSEYALAAAVITDDVARRERLASAFDVGIVWIQCSQPAFTQLPWGGRRRSGFGRDLGANGMDKYMHQKQIVEYTSGAQFEWYPMFKKSKL